MRNTKLHFCPIVRSQITDRRSQWVETAPASLVLL
jgi:hypothetical protein